MTTTSIRRSIMCLACLLMFQAGPAIASWDLTVKGFGIGLGTTERVNGFRLVFSKTWGLQVNGIQLSLFPPVGKQKALNGVAIGLFSLRVHEMQGLSVAVFTSDGLFMNGVSLAAVIVRATDLKGLALGFGGVHARKSMRGIALGGIVGAQKFSGLAAGAVMEVNVLSGVALSGMGLRSTTVKGLVVTGLILHSQKSFSGMALSAGFVSLGKGWNWKNWVALEEKARAQSRLVGLALGGVGLKAHHFTGFAIGGVVTRVGRMKGVSFGLLNFSKQLTGIQIGLLNYAANNPKYLRLLPLVNANFSSSDDPADDGDETGETQEVELEARYPL